MSSTPQVFSGAHGLLCPHYTQCLHHTQILLCPHYRSTWEQIAFCIHSPSYLEHTHLCMHSASPLRCIQPCLSTSQVSSDTYIDSDIHTRSPSDARSLFFNYQVPSPLRFTQPACPLCTPLAPSGTQFSVSIHQVFLGTHILLPPQQKALRDTQAFCPHNSSWSTTSVSRHKSPLVHTAVSVCAKRALRHTHRQHPYHHSPMRAFLAVLAALWVHTTPISTPGLLVYPQPSWTTAQVPSGAHSLLWPHH